MNAQSPDIEAAFPPGTSPTEASAAATLPADIATMPFDRALAELQAVVGKLESGGLPLEQSIALYERGVALHERCAGLLTAAELRVQRLVEGAGDQLVGQRLLRAHRPELSQLGFEISHPVPDHIMLPSSDGLGV